MKKVKCIDARNMSRIQVGKIYEVEIEDTVHYYLVGLPKNAGFFKQRFEEVVETITIPAVMVKCIDDSGTKGEIVIGRTYQVERDRGSDYKLVGVPTSWLKERFVVVQSTSTTTSDPEEERLWQLFRPRVDANQCACGMLRQQCDYHKS